MDSPRYTRVAIALHWSIATLMLLQFASGAVMKDLAEARATMVLGGVVYALHKSIGLTVLALSLLRLGWRLSHPAPPLPPGMASWQRAAAKAVHIGFYAVMIGAPLAGWALVSWSPVQIQTEWFGLFVVPHWPAPPFPAAELALRLHGLLAWLGVALLVLHVAAALRHQFVQRDRLLARMGLGGR